MRVKRKTINYVKGKPALQKALALAICLKHKVGRSSIIREFSINKIHMLTGISAVTAKKYLPIIVDNGWAEYCGSNHKHLVLKNLSSNTHNRNICVDKFCYDSYKDVYRSLRAYVALMIQARKNFVKHALQTYANPKNWAVFKKAKKLVKRLVKQGVLKTMHSAYKEYGISFNRVAKETGNCVRTAQTIIQYAIDKGWTTKEKRQEQTYAQKVSFRNVDGFEFSTKNNLYKIYANSYSINNDVENDMNYIVGIC